MKDLLIKSFNYKGETLQIVELFKNEPFLFLLDSSQNDSIRGRYSFIGFDPFYVFKYKGRDSIDLLKANFLEYKMPYIKSNSLTPLTCGAVGFISYDFGLYHEKINLNSIDDFGLPDCIFGFYDTIITIDHFDKKLYITSSGLPEKDETLSKIRASERLNYIIKKFDSGEYKLRNKQHYDVVSDINNKLTFECNFTQQQYLNSVSKALDYIGYGDIYQVNLSQRFHYDIKGFHYNPIEIYEMLRNLSPSSFGCYFDCESFHIISSSPERFLNLNNGIVQTRPMKGTWPRGETKDKDKILRDEFINSKKDQAELLMITDLERNDLGKVCEYGTVRVNEMRTLEKYRTVYQATSNIEGILRKDKDCFDLIKACFPGGSITGCPKIRSMEIIEELEPTRRSIYTGSLGYISFTGEMDFNILIRTLLGYKQKMYFQVGGGIVADSNPESEYQETLVKAKAMQRCLSKIFSREKVKV